VGKAIEMYMEEKDKGIPVGLSEEEVKKIKPKRARIAISKPGRKIGACPECGSSTIEYEGGCFVCKSCGYSECE